MKLRQKPSKCSDYKRDFKHYGREVYEVEGEVRVGTQRMYKVRGLSNLVFPSDLMKISGAEEAPDDIIEEQRRRFNPEDSGEADAEIEAPEGFGDMYEDALRELFFVFSELSGIKDVDEEVETEGIQMLHRQVLSGEWSPKDLEALGLTPDEAGERDVMLAIRVRSKFRSGIIKRFLKSGAAQKATKIRWRGGVLRPAEEPKARISRPVWRSGVLSSA